MYKASIDLFRIGKSMRIKFGLIVHGDKEEQSNKLIDKNKIVNKFQYQGNEFFRISPSPFITIDISDNSTKTEGWSSNNMVNLNRYGLYRFAVNLKKLIFDMNNPAYKGLFFIKNGHKYIDKNLAKQCQRAFRVSNDKCILIEPTVVVDENVEYEGCIFCINSYSFYTYLTLEEMEYLLNELIKIDLNSLTLNVIQLIKMDTLSIQQTIIQHIENEVQDIESTPTLYVKPIDQDSNLPDI